MGNRRVRSRIRAGLLYVMVCWGPLGCAFTLQGPESALDTPEHHRASGFKLLERGYLDDAQREFELALRHSPDNSDASRGLGLVRGRKGDYEQGLEALAKAAGDARTPEEKALALVGMMQIHTWRKGAEWLPRVEGLFREAVSLGDPLPEAYFHLGLAYREADRPADCRRALEKVLELNSRLVPQATRELQKTGAKP